VARPKSKEPTDRELMILNVLWTRGPSTVRDVHEELRKELTVGYTSVLKILQIMLDKGLVKRDESSYSHVYEAASSKEETQTKMVNSVLNKVFGGSATSLVMRALSSQPTSHEELIKIRALIEKLEKEQS
jgi:BlaI family transcriptional regulator, penicillinase repressor